MEDTLREVYQSSNERGREVLILVLMEDTLRGCSCSIYHSYWVLILVLMEDTLRVQARELHQGRQEVLILVLMEDTLRVVKMTEHLLKASLNPCFNGRYS